MSYKFIQMSDPQLGFCASRRKDVNGVDYEITNLKKAISIANEIKPDFVITTGDFTQDRLNSEHAEIVIDLYSTLNSPHYFAPGNADLTNSPQFEDIDRFRRRFGSDYQSFYFLDSQFIILNSCVLFDCTNVLGADVEQIKFLEEKLKEGFNNNCKEQMIFMHHPLFGQDPYEKDDHMVLPKNQRKIILNLLEKYNVTAVFTGHWHENNIVNYKNTELITTGPISLSLGEEPSGIRLIEVTDNKLEHRFIYL
ncbi:MAG: hypothetical protein CL758_04045 [Chloroflexi bacterium]|nr:hypothetical protein [Chloroflexota bacterium]|tara:strand:+ start:3570 stop:4325 length:756 start_codon:yes stop_codon:yes gene_type:complete